MVIANQMVGPDMPWWPYCFHLGTMGVGGAFEGPLIKLVIWQLAASVYSGTLRRCFFHILYLSNQPGFPVLNFRLLVVVPPFETANFFVQGSMTVFDPSVRF